MKLYTFLLPTILCFSTLAFSSPLNSTKIKQAVKSGDWSDPKVWTNEDIPSSGDYILIPNNCQISISDNIDFSQKDEPNIIYLHGSLLFESGGKIHLPAGSTINVEKDGLIQNVSADHSFDRIRIGNSIYFTANDESIKGPYIVQKSTSPAEFIKFSVALLHKRALIQWTTSNAVNNNKFELQRNINMNNWETIAIVSADLNNKPVNIYRFEDKDPSCNIANYRLKIIDVSGAYAFSPVKSIRNGEIGPNVFIGSCTSGNLVVHFSQQISSSLIFKLEDLSGKVIETMQIRDPVGDVPIKIRNVASGSYMATVTGPSGFRYIQPVKF